MLKVGYLIMGLWSFKPVLAILPFGECLIRFFHNKRVISLSFKLAISLF